MHDIIIRWGERSARLSPDQIVTIGSQAGATLVIPDPTIAPQHLLVSWEDGFWVAREQGGGAMLVEGQRMDAVRVERRLVLHLGSVSGPELVLDPAFGVGDHAAPAASPVVAAPGPAPAMPAAGGPSFDLGGAALGGETVLITDTALRVTVDGQERVFHPGQRVVVGRDPSCDLSCDNPLVSRKHCAFVYEGAQWWLEDLNSSRGTFVDKRKVSGRQKVEGAFFVILGDDDAGEQVRVITAGEHRVPKSKLPLALGLGGLLLGAAALIAVFTLGGGGDDDARSISALPLETVVADAGQTSGDPTVAADVLAPSVVRPVLTTVSGQVCAFGSGTVVGEGLILTNFHVVGLLPGESPDCRFRGDIAVAESPDQPARLRGTSEIIAIDPAADLAVLRLNEDLGLPIVPITMERPAIGSRVRIFGYPGIGGDTLTVTSGEVSGFLDDANVGPGAWIKTDATIAGGNSGGAAFNDAGELVGVPTIVGAGTSGDAVECRPLADTNGDGQLTGADSCVTVGGFLNGIRPASLALPLIEAAETADPISFDDPSLDLNAVAENADYDDIRVEDLRIDGFDSDGENVALDSGDVNFVCASYTFSGVDQGLLYVAAWGLDDNILFDGAINALWGAGESGETTTCYRPLGGVPSGEYLFALGFGFQFEATFEVAETVS